MEDNSPTTEPPNWFSGNRTVWLWPVGWLWFWLRRLNRKCRMFCWESFVCRYDDRRPYCKRYYRLWQSAPDSRGWHVPGPPVGRWSRFWLIFQNPGGTSPDWYNSVWFWAFEYLYRPDNPDLHKPGAGQSLLCLRKWLVPHTVGHKDDFRSWAIKHRSGGKRRKRDRMGCPDGIKWFACRFAAGSGYLRPANNRNFFEPNSYSDYYK